MRGFDAGSVFVKLGFDVDDSGADRYDRREADIRRRAAKPIEQRVGLDVDERSFREAASKSAAAEKGALKVREAQLKLETATEKATAAEQKHGRESLEYRRTALAVEKATHGLADSQSELDRKVSKVARTMAVDAQRANDGYARSIGRVDHAIETVDGSTRRMGRGVANADRDVGRLRMGMGRLGGISASVATGIAGTGIAVVGAAAGFKELVGAYQESYKIGQQTEAVIKSTGGAAKVTAEEVGDLATALSRKTGVDDEAIQAGENLLLTFKAVRNEVGQGNDIFNQTTAIAVDMAAALGTDVKAAAMQLGKSLNDPEKGMARLTKSGVTFTDEQKKQVAALVESGDVMEAQKIILRELESEFGGSAKAQATNTDRMKVSLGNLAETVGEKLAPAAEKASGIVSRFLDDLADGEGPAGRFARRVSAGATAVAGFASDIGDAADAVIGWFREVYEENADTIGQIGTSFSHLAAIGGKALDQIKDALSDVFGGRSSTSRDIRKIISVVLDVQAAILRVYEAVAERALPGIITAFRGAATVIRGIVKVVAGILTLDFGKAWDGVKDIFGGGVKFIGGVIRAGTAPLRTATAAMGKAVSGPLTGVWGGIKSAWRGGLDFILGGVSTASGAIAKLLDAAGHLPGVGGKFKSLADDVRKGQKAIDDYRESLRKADREHARTSNIKKLQDEVGGLRSKLRTLKRGTDDYRDTAAKLQTRQRTLNAALADGQAAGKKGAKGVKEIGTAGGNSATAVYEAATSITGNLIAVSKGLGIKAPSFAVRPAKATGLGVGVYASGSADLAEAKANSHAVGGIPNPGSGAADDHMLVDRSGRPVAMMSGTEGILNTPQMQIVDQALQVASMVGVTPYAGLSDLWSSGMRHYAGGGLMGAKPGLQPYANAAAKFGLSVSSGGRPGAVTSSGNRSQHASGDAIDLVGPAGSMLSFARSFGAKYGASVDQLIHTPLGYGYSRGQRVNLGYFGPTVNADHYDHVHIGDSTPGGAGGLGAGGGGQIATPRINGPAGQLLSMSRAAAGRMAKDANSWLDRQSASMGAEPVGGGLTSAGGKWSKARLMALWKRHNSNGDPNLMAAIALAESSGDPNSIGIPTSGGRAQGLWQIMWPAHASTFPGRNPLNVDDNAIMAGSILKSQGLGAWEAYTRGMHVKFLAKGGQPKKSKRLSPSRTAKARAMLAKLWDGARGYYPGAGSREPRSKYGATSGLEGSTVGMLANAGGGRGGRYVNWPEWTLEDLTGSNHARSSAMAETAIHEWAHYFQSPKVFAKTPGITYMEGGAQAFTRRVAPQVFRSLGLPFKLQSQSDDLYYPYARHVERNMGEKWVTRDQFNQPASLKYKYPRGVKGPYGYALGGLLTNVPRFKTGGKLGKKKPSFKESTLAKVGLGGSEFRALRGTQSDRIGDFDAVSELLETDGKRYGLQERRNDLTDEVLIDEETGQVNVGDVKRRAAELQKLADIKRRMLARLKKGRTIARRVQKTYSTILTRLKKALSAATRGKKGKTSKSRKEAAKSYREQIRDYVGRRKEWAGKEQDLGFDIEDGSIDLESLIGERSGVLGTKATPPDVDTDTPADPDPGDADGGGGDPATPTEPPAAPPTAEDIAQGVAEQFASFNQGRADLFGSFGGNFVRNTLPQSFGGNVDDGGARYFGGGASGTSGGAVTAAGGQSGPTEGGITQNLYFNGPQPVDPHATTAALLHELQAVV